MNTALVLLVAIIGVALYLRFQSKKGEELKNQELKKRMTDLELARKAKELDTDINTIKKQIAETKLGKSLAPIEVENFWKNQ